MRSDALLIISLLLFHSCTTGVNLRYVDLGPALHDNSSKVWIVEKQFVKDINIAPANDYQKDLMIFYKTGTVNITPMRKIGEDAPLRGKYTYDSQRRKMTIEFMEEDNWKLDITYITEDSIYLTRTNAKEGSVGIQLKPLPPL